MTTQLLTSITALDQSKETIDQATLNEIKTQRDLYRKTMYTFAEMLKGLDEQKTSLLGRLVFPMNDVHQDPNSLMTWEPDHCPVVTPESTDAIALIHEIEGLDDEKQQLTQELIEKCSRQRDKYKEVVYKLKGAITSCQEAVNELEARLAAQARILSTPKIVEKASPATFSPNTLEQRQQIRMLRDEVAKVKGGRISAKEREGALQNYIFLLFVQEKDSRKESFSLSTFNPTDLSVSDQTLLKEVTQKAVQNMDPKSFLPYDLQRLFGSKKRNIDGKIRTIKNLKVLFGETDTGMTQLEGKARDLFSHFFILLKFSQKDTSVKKDYEDFIFSHDPFLAADLLLAEKIYEECRAYYEKTRGPTDPQLVMINEKISQIKEVQRLFLILLENCQVR